jgi:hypothetical protein
MPHHLRIELTAIQAECLLELAQEAEIEALAGRRRRAAEAAMAKLIRALARAEQLSI